MYGKNAYKSLFICQIVGISKVLDQNADMCGYNAKVAVLEKRNFIKI